MKKKLFALLLCLALALTTLAGCGGSGDEETTKGGGEETTKGESFELILHQHDPELSATGQFLNDFAAAVDEASDGRLKIKVYHGGVLGTPKDTVSMVQNGTCDIGWGLQSFFAGTFPASEVFSLPLLGIESAVQGSSAFWEFYETTDFLDKEYEGFHTLFLHTNCDSPIATVSKKLETVDGFAGLQLRANSGPPTTFVQKLGANPVAITIGEVYESLEKGVIDGIITDWHAIKSFKFYEALNYYIDESVGVSTYFMLMNQAKYDALPEDLQKILDDEAAKAAQYTSAWDEYETEVRDIIATEGGEIYKLADAEKAKLQELADTTTEEWIASMTEKGYDGQAIYDKAKELVDKYAK